MSTTLMRHSKLFIGSAAVLLAGAASAQVSVYGLVDMSYGQNEFLEGKAIKADFHSGGDTGSSQGNSTTRLGVKASTEVAPGVKANANFETAGITSDGSVGGAGTPFFNRQAWAGFSGSFGEVRLGKQDSVAFQLMTAFDFNGASNVASALGYSGVAAWLPGRQDRSLQYISPDLAGLKVQAGFQPEGNVVGAKSNFSIGGVYTLGKLVVGATAESKRTTAGEDFVSVAASYDFGVAKVMASYADGGDPLNGGSGKGAGIGAVAPVAGFNVGFHYGDNSDTDVKALELFVNREVFKSTYAYVDYGRIEDAAGVKYNNFGVGMIYAF